MYNERAAVINLSYGLRMVILMSYGSVHDAEKEKSFLQTQLHRKRRLSISFRIKPILECGEIMPDNIRRHKIVLLLFASMEVKFIFPMI